MNVTLSLIIPVYNVSAYIERCIKSIINQTNTDFEIVLVDDCGQDDSMAKAIALLDSSSLQYKTVRRKQNGGLSAARNSGIEASSGDYLFFVDSDDELAIDAIEHIQDVILKNRDASIFLFNATYKKPTDTLFNQWRQGGQIPNLLTVSECLHLLYKGKIGAYIWQFVFKRSLFEKIKFREGAVWEDSIIVPCLISNSNGVVSYDEYFIYKYWIREGSISQSIHPFIEEVVPALNEVESNLYSTKKEHLYNEFVLFRTTLTMRLSRECFVRTKEFRRLMEIHKRWGKDIPQANIVALKEMGKRKSAFFLKLIKYSPQVLFFLYKIKVLR